jgi:glucan phosphorylase
LCWTRTDRTFFFSDIATPSDSVGRSKGSRASRGRVFGPEGKRRVFHISLVLNLIDLSYARITCSAASKVLAVAYDSPVPGHGTKSTANIRFWSARPVSGFDLVSFNAGDYQASVQASSEAETLTRALYPNDNHDAGKQLRLRQQSFWTAASLADILRRSVPSSRSLPLEDQNSADSVRCLVQIPKA